MRLTFEDPADLLRLLTVQRLRVLRAVRQQPAPLSDLARTLKRDRTAVKRDVKVLVTYGLVKTHEETNRGMDAGRTLNRSRRSMSGATI